MSKMARGFLTVFLCVLAASFTLFEGVASADIIVGMSSALEGPTMALGQGMKAGIEAYFKKVNDAGGVGGQKIRFIAHDDGYEPSRAAPNMRRLIDDENAVAVVGNVGTPTAIVTVPIANEKKTLLFGAFTGAGVLRKTPPDRYVINYRASYEDETAAMVDGILSAGIKPEEIAFFTQDDSYGDAGYNGAVKAIKERGFASPQKLSHGRYTRNTLNVENGLATVLNAEVLPRAVIMVGAYAPCAKFIKMAKELLPDTFFMNVSFVGSMALKEALGGDAEGVIVTQVVPNLDSDLPLVREYHQSINNYSKDAKPDFVSLEGYIAARIFAEGLKRSAGSPTREGIIDAIEGINGLDIGIGVPINYGKNQHQASHKVWPTMIKNGKFSAFEWSELKAK